MKTPYATISALLGEGRYAQAEQHARALAVRDPGDAVALAMLGVSLTAQGQAAAGVDALDRAVALRPDDAQTHLARANALRTAGRIAPAVQAYRRALELRPGYADAASALVATLLAGGDHGGALAAASQALRQHPDAKATLLDFGNSAQAAGRWDLALEAFERLCKLHPDDADGRFNLGNALSQAGRSDEAISAYRRTLELRPDHLPCTTNLARALGAAGRLDEATALYRQVLTANPVDAIAHNNLASLLVRAGDSAAAERHFRAALAVAPHYAPAWSNLGALLHTGRRLDEAIAAHRRAVDLSPGEPAYRHNLALARLTCGDYPAGWRDFEARLGTQPAVVLGPVAAGPRWDGVTAAPDGVMILAEAGLGDIVQALRYGPWLRARGIRTTLRCAAALCPLAAASGTFDAVESTSEPAPGGRTWFPLLSLPGLAHPTSGAMPMTAPYLHAAPERIDRWASTVRQLPGLRVAIAWQGNPAAEQGVLRGRSVPLHHFGSLARLPGVTLISVQQNSGVEQIASSGLASAIVTWGSRLDASGGAFADTSAVLMHADLLITSDTAVAHVAGALGRPVWVALHASPDWRWGTDGETTPWYPTMRLFRQARAGDWSNVFARIAAQLQACVDRRQA